MLDGLRIAVDVQHLYRANKPNDRGAVFTLPDHTRTNEADAALIYAAALTSWLRERGASALTNDVARQILVGPYSWRHRAVSEWRAHAYLACHLNAGRGSYSLMEHMSLTRGAELAALIGPRLMLAFPGITASKVRALSDKDRGAVCIRGVPGSIAAVLCEPFFGDWPGHQSLLSAPKLVALGRVIGEAVAEWWLTHPPAENHDPEPGPA